MKGLWARLRNIDVNRSAALTAVLISVCALYVSVQQTRLMRTQQKVSFYPHLTLMRSYTAEGFAVKIKNSGTGLALVNAMQLTDGDNYYRDWPDLMQRLMSDSLAYGYDKISANSINGEVITPGESIVLFQIDWLPGVRELELATRQLTMRVCYSSLLEETWLLENDIREKIDRPCDRDPERAFN